MKEAQNLIEISMDNNTKFYIEAVQTPALDGNDPLLVPAASGDKVIKKTRDFLKDSITQIKGFSDNIAEAIEDSRMRPDELELEFGIKFAADAGIIISSISSEANLTVKMKWNKEQIQK